MRVSLLLIFALFHIALFSQSISGHLMIVGGGSEKINGWSDDPYTWAVDQSNNKRVAIVTYGSDPGVWLPNYFKNLGAVEAKNFIIPNASVANLQETYDSLVTYDVVFFKGGDQSKYYEYYKNTLTQQAVQQVFDNGGVICGTSAGLAILSKVIYTAENGSVYSDEALENPFNNYMTLENDFFDFMSGYIFDSHFVERARFGRLLGFLGKWNIEYEEILTGIGVDDKTAFCIDSDLMGYAYGTAAVNIYKSHQDNEYRLSGEKLLANYIETTQLLNECTINLNTFEYTGLNTWLEPLPGEFTFFNNLWLSGSDKIYDNTLFLEKFSKEIEPQDTVLIITGISTSHAGFFADYLDDLGTPNLIFQAISINVNDPLWNLRIESFKSYLFVGNDYESLMEFMGTWPNGNLLKDLAKNGEKQVAMVGDNSRFAGKTVLVNYDQEYASYDGELEYEPGLGLLHNAIVMPKTFSNDIDKENAAAGVPYGMVMDNLKYGIWLHDDCFLQYTPVGDYVNITSFGEFPMIWIENHNGTYGDFSTQSAVNSGELRDVAGFGQFKLSLRDSTVTQITSLVESVDELNKLQINIYPNPAKNLVYVKGLLNKEINITIFDLKGTKVLDKVIWANESLNIASLPSSSYIVRISDRLGENINSVKLIIQ